MRAPNAAQLLEDDRIALRADDIARLLSLSRKAAFGLARQIGRKHGRRVLVERAALDEWLRSLPRANGDRT